jgi:hypothetical protein
MLARGDTLCYARSTVGVAGRGASSGLRKWCIETQGADWKTGVGSGVLRVPLIAQDIAEWRKMAADVDKYSQVDNSAQQAAEKTLFTHLPRHIKTRLSPSVVLAL